LTDRQQRALILLAWVSIAAGTVALAELLYLAIRLFT
jgi:hypothetical protein